MSASVGEDGRYEVVRTLKEGEERRLPDHIRKLVLRRDRYLCVFCGKGGRLEADHIIPWSAGGSDDLDNLRTLCHNCNQERSNFRTISDEHRRLPNAHECVYCNSDLIGDPELTAVYCILCNKKAPGLPRNPQEREPQEIVEYPEEVFYDERVAELESLAAKHRATALETVRQALTTPAAAVAGTDQEAGK